MTLYYGDPTMNLVHCWTEIKYSNSRAFRQVGLSALSTKKQELPYDVGSQAKLQVTYYRQSGIKQVQSTLLAGPSGRAV